MRPVRKVMGLSIAMLWMAACGTSSEPVPTPPPRVRAPAVGRPQTQAEMEADYRHTPHPGDGGGHLRWSGSAPGPLVAGSPVELSATYVVGPHGVAVGGFIEWIPSPFWGWTAPQDRGPGPGWTQVEGPSRSETTLVSIPGPGSLRLEVVGQPLVEGDEIRFRYGVEQSARADRFAERGPAVFVGVDADGDGLREVAEGLPLTVVAAAPAQVVATLPSTARPGDTVQLRLAVLDAAGNAWGRYASRLALSAADGVQLPPDVALAPADRGVASVPITVAEPGVVRVQVSGVGSAIASNPMVVRAEAEPVLWGDLQIHTAWSDGSGHPEDVWRYARDVAGLDVAAITDHDHWGLQPLDEDPERRQALDAAVAAVHKDGGFVALHGYEYTHWTAGHRHVLYFDGPGPVFSAVDPATNTPRALWEALEGRDAITVPHHPAGGPVALDWSTFPEDPQREPVVEIASVHGQSESADGPSPIYDAQDGAFAFAQLVAGRRFGFIGSTDGHDGHPGLSHLVAGRGGLVGLVGAQRTRASVAATLRARRVYATNGPRIVLRFDVSGTPLGGVHPSGGPVTVTVRAIGTAPIDRVELVSRHGVVGSRRGTGPVAFAQWPLDAPTPGDFVYVRVVQADGGLAWASPVFFD